MAKVLHVQIASVLGEVYQGDAQQVVLPSVAGELGILPDHVPVLAKLKAGNIRLYGVDGTMEFVYVSGGYVEVNRNHIHVLADIGYRSKAFEDNAAQEAQRLTQEAAQRGIPAPDFGRAYAELLNQLSQLSAEKETRKRR